MSLVMGDTPEQLEQGLLINGELWTAKRIAELQAQVEQLRETLSRQLNDCINFDGSKLTDAVMAESSRTLKNTPAQCLAEIRAQDRKNGFIAGFFHCRNYGFQFEDELKEASYKYADKMCEAAKEG